MTPSPRVDLFHVYCPFVCELHFTVVVIFQLDAHWADLGRSVVHVSWKSVNFCLLPSGRSTARHDTTRPTDRHRSFGIRRRQQQQQRQVNRLMVRKNFRIKFSSRKRETLLLCVRASSFAHSPQKSDVRRLSACVKRTEQNITDRDGSRRRCFHDIQIATINQRRPHNAWMHGPQHTLDWV